MPVEHAPLSYGRLMAELATLCAAGRTGTMFIATTDNHAARIGLRQGKIVALVFRNQRGLDALDHIRKVTAGRWSFSDAVMDRGGDTDLPNTPELLALLTGEEPPAPLQPTTVPAPAESPRSPAPAVPPATMSPLLAKARRTIEAELTEFAGPIAPLLCRPHFERAAAAGPPWDWREIVEAVAREIGDPAKEARFKQQALAKLRER